MKRITPLILSLIIIIPFINNMNVQALNFPLNNAIKSESAIVLNLDNDIIIHEKNADTKQMPGSLVNIMTAIICLENTRDLSKEITIDKSVFADLKNVVLTDDVLSGNVYGEYASFFWTEYGDLGDVSVCSGKGHHNFYGSYQCYL